MIAFNSNGWIMNHSELNGKITQNSFWSKSWWPMKETYLWQEIFHTIKLAPGHEALYYFLQSPRIPGHQPKNSALMVLQENMECMLTRIASFLKRELIHSDRQSFFQLIQQASFARQLKNQKMVLFYFGVILRLIKILKNGQRIQHQPA